MKSKNTSQDLDSVMQCSFDFPMSTRARAIADQHVSRAIAMESAHRNGSSRRFILTRSRGLLLGGVAAALLAGSVAASGGLFDRLIGGAPVLQAAWQNAADVGASVTDSGYTIVLEKAAVDGEHVWVALAMVESPSPADFGQMQMTDANGVVLSSGTGAGSGDVRGESAMIFGFTIPDGVTPQGPFTLEVTSVTDSTELIAGHWTFTFDVAKANGS